MIGINFSKFGTVRLIHWSENEWLRIGCCHAKDRPRVVSKAGFQP